MQIFSERMCIFPPNPSQTKVCNFAKYLRTSKKSSTFALDLAL